MLACVGAAITWSADPVRFPFVDISRLVNFESGVPLLLSGHSLHVTVAKISMQRRTRLGNMLRLSLPIRLTLRHLSRWFWILLFVVCCRSSCRSHRAS